MAQLQVRVGVGIFVLASSHESPSNPHFLVGKRLGSHGAGTYALPGGHLEFGESLEECAARELEEETGLKVNVEKVQFLTATNNVMHKDGKHYVTLFMVCERDDEAQEAELKEPDKCEGWKWWSWEDFLGYVKMEKEVQGCEKVEVRLFEPLLNLVEQRPGLILTS